MKRHQALFSVSVVTTPEAEDAVTELLQKVTGAPATSYEDLESGEVTATVYLESRDNLSKDTANRVRTGLDRIKESGLQIGRARVVAKKVGNAWLESWKRHFKPLNIGNRLLLKPSWSARKAKHGQETIVLDPGLSFGTGQHPTTAFCLAELVRRRTQLRDETLSFLDLGTGSGILAIAAAKLGYDPIAALDFDPESVRVAKANARRNKVSVPFSRQDIAKMPLKSRRTFSVVCANVTANILMDCKQTIGERVAPNGLLVLAGILEREFDAVQGHYEALGFRLVRARTVREWRSGSFRRI